MVVQKGEYKPGDLTVYVEIDSVLPAEKPEFEFLRKNNFRIKTMKLNGIREDGTKVPIYSQGICFPLSVLPGSIPEKITDDEKNLFIGTDVTEFLGIKKYDEYGDESECDAKDDNVFSVKQFMFKHELTRPIAKMLFGKNKKNSTSFPSFIEKTDETRIQSLPYLLEKKDIKFVGREKIDGQSGTFILKRVRDGSWLRKPKYEFIVCSRNKRIPVPDDSPFWTVARKYNIESVLKSLIGDDKYVCIQGEVVGPKIQGNKYKLSEVDLYCFNLIYPNGKVECDTAEGAVGRFGLKWVPMVTVDYTMPDTVEEVLAFATGKSALCDTLREGIVFRNYEHDISFKAVSPDFLIKHES